MLDFKKGIISQYLELWIINLVRIILKRYWGDSLLKFYRIDKVSWTIVYSEETLSLTPGKVFQKTILL